MSAFFWVYLSEEINSPPWKADPLKMEHRKKKVAMLHFKLHLKEFLVIMMSFFTYLNKNVLLNVYIPENKEQR